MFFFVLSRAWDKEKKILSPHEEANLKPSDSALRCSDESEGLILKVRFLVGSQNFFLCPTLVTRRKKHLFCLYRAKKTYHFSYFYLQEKYYLLSEQHHK